MPLPRSSGVLLHPTSLPGGRLGDEAYRFVDWLAGGRPVVVADPAARPARRARLALPRPPSAFAGSPGLLADPDAPVSAAEIESFVARHRVLDRRLGARSPATARSPTRCGSSASGARCARTRQSAACALIGDLPIYVAPGGADHRAHPELFQDGVVAGVPPDDCSDDRPALGQPALRLARRCAATQLPLVGRALPPDVRARRRRAHRPLPRLRRLLGRARRSARRRATARWRRGPGRELFDAVVGASSATLPLIAEDLGVITPAVERLRDELGLPGRS